MGCTGSEGKVSAVVARLRSNGEGSGLDSTSAEDDGRGEWSPLAEVPGYGLSVGTGMRDGRGSVTTSLDLWTNRPSGSLGGI
jgi:hypothetical protein